MVYAALKSIERKGHYVPLAEVFSEAKSKIAASSKETV